MMVISDHSLSHIAPLGWEHITFNGPCCTDQQPGAVSPRSNILREANLHRPPKLERTSS
jgi:hypothetical protein